MEKGSLYREAGDVAGFGILWTPFASFFFNVKIIVELWVPYCRRIYFTNLWIGYNECAFRVLVRMNSTNQITKPRPHFLSAHNYFYNLHNYLHNYFFSNLQNNKTYLLAIIWTTFYYNFNFNNACLRKAHLL